MKPACALAPPPLTVQHMSSDAASRSPREPAPGDVVEHAMRVLRDDAPVAALTIVPPGSREYLARVGRVLGAITVPPAGTPLIAAARRKPASPHWRELVPPVERSLYAELEHLMAFFSMSGYEGCPYEQLELLRARFGVTAS